MLAAVAQLKTEMKSKGQAKRRTDCASHKSCWLSVYFTSVPSRMLTAVSKPAANLRMVLSTPGTGI